ncbi:MAG: SRPBCC family protein [Fibrobacteres bacterium]|jgi:uncharacterized protein YndB with AHSA1/START domain|nr:SRPBCC family protein [Fibrobacterota bacterium]
MGNTVLLHRVFKSSPEKLYKAFLDPAANAKWLPPYGFTATVHEMDVRVGGKFRMSFTNFGTGSSNSFGGTYLELVPNEKIRYTDQFDDPSMPDVIEVTVELRPVLCGTDLQVIQANLPESIPVEFCYLGWQESLAQLAHLVEPEIPDGA